MSEIAITGKIEYNIDRPNYRANQPNSKWTAIRDVVGAMTVVPANRTDGWVKIPMINKEAATHASIAANTAGRREAKKDNNGWLIQTSVEETDSGAFLYLRKVKK